MLSDFISWIKRKPKIEYVYKIEWYCCDGREGHYQSYTLKEIRDKVDSDNSLWDCEKQWLKYGCYHEFEKDIRTCNYCIDNGFDIHWYKYRLIY